VYCILNQINAALVNRKDLHTFKQWCVFPGVWAQDEESPLFLSHAEKRGHPDCFMRNSDLSFVHVVVTN